MKRGEEDRWSNPPWTTEPSSPTAVLGAPAATPCRLLDAPLARPRTGSARPVDGPRPAATWWTCVGVAPARGTGTASPSDREPLW